MARKGSKKVKTGCRTCKIRKVKCDEQRPACVRCTSTGRSCDGYDGPRDRNRGPAAADGAVAVRHVPHAKLAPRTAVWLVTGPRLTEPESRSFQHYQEVTAPEYSRVCDDFFWRGAVMVLGQTQPAVQHALIAVSSIHEQFHLGAAAGPTVDFATRQYNTAIRHMISKTAADDERETGAILVVSTLFATLEFLLGNHATAIEHCRHSVLIFNGMRSVSPWMRKNLLPFVRRATTYPLFLAGHIDYMPLPALVDDFGGALRRTTFHTLDEAREVLHGLASQATRLLHLANPFRIGSRRAEPIPEALRAEHHAALAALDRWSEMFATFRALPRGASPPRQHWYVDPLTELQMRALTARAWLAAHYDLDAGELAFDDHMDAFRRINDLARSMVRQKNCGSDDDQQNHQAARFRFDVGIMPPLYFTIRWCRDLAVRLDALRLLCQLCHGGECIFDVYTLASALRAVIDREHAIDLASLPWRGGDSVHGYLPAYRDHISAMNPQAWAPPAESVPAERRIWDAIIMPQTAQAPEPVVDGKATGRCRVRYVEVVNDRVCQTDETVTVTTNFTANAVASGTHARRMAALRKSLQNADPLVHGPALWLSWGGC